MSLGQWWELEDRGAQHCRLMRAPPPWPFGRLEGHDVEDVHRQAAYVCPRQVKPLSTTAPAALFLGSRESRNAAGCNTDEHLDEYDEHLDEDDAKRHRRARRHWPLAP